MTSLKLADRFVGAQIFLLCFSLPPELLFWLMPLCFTKWNLQMLTSIYCWWPAIVHYTLHFQEKSIECLNIAMHCMLSRVFWLLTGLSLLWFLSLSLIRWNCADGKDGAESCGFSSWMFQVRFEHVCACLHLLTVVFFFFFTFIQQGCIKLIRSHSKGLIFFK